MCCSIVRKWKGNVATLPYLFTFVSFVVLILIFFIIFNLISDIVLCHTVFSVICSSIAGAPTINNLEKKIYKTNIQQTQHIYYNTCETLEKHKSILFFYVSFSFSTRGIIFIFIFSLAHFSYDSTNSFNKTNTRRGFSLFKINCISFLS